MRLSTWEDAKGTFNNACLIGPPLLEYSIYKKTPLNKRHGDTRQGTIDQDPEFMAFLEELASPPVFKDATDDIDEMSKSAKVTTTPLVEFLKEKKANKSKEAANKKREARAEKNKAKEEESSKKKGKDAKQEKASRVSVKILTKKGNPEPEQEASKRKQGKDANISTATTDASQDAPKSRRAEIAAAAKALQRDQGLSPGTAHRKARQDAAKADAGARSEAKAENKENAAKKAANDDEDNQREGLHPWLAPVIRFVCSESDNKRIAPTVLAGVEIIACPGGRRTEDVWVNEHPTEMLMAIAHAVFMQLKLLTTDQADEETLHVPLRKEIMDLMNRARSEVVFLGMEEDGAWEGWSKIRVKDFEDALVYSKEQKWLDSDWFRNIADVVSAGQADADPVDQDEGDAGSGPGGRADTMFQDRYDFLSEARKADYRVWKSTQLDRISQMLVAGGAMDVDE